MAVEKPAVQPRGAGLGGATDPFIYELVQALLGIYLFHSEHSDGDRRDSSSQVREYRLALRRLLHAIERVAYEDPREVTRYWREVDNRHGVGRAIP